MVDAALIQQCANPGLEPAIVEKFIAEPGSPDPLAVWSRPGATHSGSRLASKRGHFKGPRYLRP